MRKNHARINDSFTNTNNGESSRDNVDSTQSSSKEPSVTIKLPFPPTVDLFDLVSKKSLDGKIPARSPNAFIIYRKVYVEAARKSGYFLPMTNISSMTSQSWADESEEVRTTYQKIAKDALKVRNEVYPKSGKRKRKDRWNIVSFETPPSTSNDVEGRKKANNKKAQRPVVRISARTSSSSSPRNGLDSFPTDLPSTSIDLPPPFDTTFYETLPIANANFAVNDAAFLNDQNQNLNVNNILDNNPDTNNKNNSDLNSGSNFKYDDNYYNNMNSGSNTNTAQILTDAHNANSAVYPIFPTFYVPPPNTLNANGTNTTPNYTVTHNNILNDDNNNMMISTRSPAISFSGENTIHYYTPPAHNIDLTQLNPVEYSLDKDQSNLP